MNAPAKINLLNLTRPELEIFITQELKEPTFRARQLWQWVWQKLAPDFDSMSNISRNLRQILKEKCVLERPAIKKIQEAQDGTVKFLLEFSDQTPIETVLIPSENRAGVIRWAQCLSTQAGCPMRCSFCATGNSPFKRNLTMGEILSQVVIGREFLKDWRPDKPILRNLVFMGMGEPLLNMEALMPALAVLGDENGLNFSPRRITVSTSGIKKGLQELGESGLAYLAVSLHATNQKLREQIMPVAAQWPLDDMLESLRQYPIKARERITFEYLLLGGVNDSISHAKELTRIASHIKAKINLINFNPVPGIPYAPATSENAQAFQDYLCSHNITAIMRKSKGPDIAAACGQLCAKNTLDSKD